MTSGWTGWSMSPKAVPRTVRRKLACDQCRPYSVRGGITAEMTTDTTHQTVLITGTSSGLGRATAKHFQLKGWNVIATMRTPTPQDELAQLERTLVARLDVQDTRSIRSAVDAGFARFGRIDTLVNNAGYGAYGPLEARSPEKIRRQFDVNVLGLLATTQAVLPHFRGNRTGTIINVSWFGGRMAFPLGTLYHRTKFAVEGLSESLYYELGALAIRVKIVEPGGMTTDFRWAFTRLQQRHGTQGVSAARAKGPRRARSDDGEWIRTRADRRSHLLRGDGRNRPTAVRGWCRCGADARRQTLDR